MPLPAVAAGIAKVGAIIGKGAMAAGKGIAAGAKAGAKISSSTLKSGSRTVSGSAKSAKNLKISVGRIRSVLNKKTKRLANLKKINVRDHNKLLSLQKRQKAEKKLESPLKGLLAPIKGIAQIGSKIFDALKFLLLGIGFTALWENAGKIAEVIGNFYKNLVSWWDKPETVKIRDNIAEGLKKVETEKILEKFDQVKELTDKLQKELKPIFEKDGWLFNEKGQIDPKTTIEDEDNPGETKRFSETFDYADDDDIKAQIEEWKSMYYVDQHGNVRFKEDNKKPFGARFMGVGTGMDFKDIKKLLERRDYNPISSTKKDDNVSVLNSNGTSKNKMIVVRQAIITNTTA